VVGVQLEAGAPHLAGGAHSPGTARRKPAGVERAEELAGDEPTATASACVARGNCPPRFQGHLQVAKNPTAEAAALAQVAVADRLHLVVRHGVLS
jgi:hypothetical protein